jgi:hypothetical protein
MLATIQSSLEAVSRASNSFRQAHYFAALLMAKKGWPSNNLTALVTSSRGASTLAQVGYDKLDLLDFWIRGDVRLDKENNTTMWKDAVHKETKNVRIAFNILNGEEAVRPTYQQTTCHMMFNVKMEDFRRKARFVSEEHITDTPHAMTYASVVSRESARIALTLAALNDLEVKITDIENAYLTAPITEKVWCILGPEFGEDTGKKALIVRALYGLKSAGAAFRNHLAECMKHLGWKSC